MTREASLRAAIIRKHTSMSPTAKDDAPNAASHRTMHEDKEDTSKGSGRTRTASSVIDADLKHEEGGPDVTMADAKPTYKSWKKKYRKMRIKFDESMAHGEQVYQQEQKALKKIKQLAIYNEQAAPIPLQPCRVDSGARLYLIVSFKLISCTAVSSICSQTSTTGHKYPRRSALMSALKSLPTRRRRSPWTSIKNHGLALSRANPSRT